MTEDGLSRGRKERKGKKAAGGCGARMDCPEFQVGPKFSSQLRLAKGRRRDRQTKVLGRDKEGTRMKSADTEKRQE